MTKIYFYSHLIILNWILMIAVYHRFLVHRKQLKLWSIVNLFYIYIIISPYNLQSIETIIDRVMIANYRSTYGCLIFNECNCKEMKKKLISILFIGVKKVNGARCIINSFLQIVINSRLIALRYNNEHY